MKFVERAGISPAFWTFNEKKVGLLVVLVVVALSLVETEVVDLLLVIPLTVVVAFPCKKVSPIALPTSITIITPITAKVVLIEVMLTYSNLNRTNLD